MEYFEGMPAASAIIMTAATGVVTKVATQGITVGDVTDSVTGASGKGFTIGLNTTVNIAAQVLQIHAE